MTRSVQPATSRTLGLLADWYDERYQRSILATVEEATAQRATNLIAFGGGIPGSSKRESALRHRAFELVAPENVEGVILLAGTMVNKLGTEALSSLVSRLEGLPLCTIGVELPGIPAILVDNQAGVDQAMNHLVNHHECREVAFIRGPNKNKEAESRFAAYKAALEREDIPLDEGLVFQGNFLRQSGEAAVATWKERGALPRAIMAANDEMALGAMQALFSLGVKIPEEVRVIGFDDIEATRHVSPPLTTVRQPLKELAVTAVRTVMDQIHGREVAPVQTLQTHLIVRDSCGCALRLTSTGQSQLPEEKPRETGAGFEEEFNKGRHALRAELSRIARGDFQSFPNWETKLIDGFIQQMSGNSDFIRTLTAYLGQIANQGGEPSRFHDVITAFRRSALPCCGVDLTLRTRCENSLQEARLLTAEATERVQARSHMRLEQFTRTLAETTAALTSSFDLKAFSTQVESRLSRLGISACYVVLYEPVGLTTPPVKALPSRSRLVAAYVAGQNSDIEAYEELDFSTVELLPESVLPEARTHQLTTLPLFLKGKELGYCMLESKDSHAAVVETLREHLSIALYGCLLAEAL